MPNKITGYHFTTSNALRDGRPIPATGEWFGHIGPIVPCSCGLHASEHPIDALKYAPGPRLHRVELAGDLVQHGDPADKWVGRRRRIIASIDATAILREHARWCALQVIGLWDAPQVVREYLETGDADIWSAARREANDAAYAAWDPDPVARIAVQAARVAWVACSAWEAAWDATWDARVAVRITRGIDAGGTTEWDAQRTHFAALVDREFAKESEQ